jgi:hypothetical protein
VDEQTLREAQAQLAREEAARKERRAVQKGKRPVTFAEERAQFPQVVVVRDVTDHHCIIRYQDVEYCYWPGTGRWRKLADSTDAVYSGGFAALVAGTGVRGGKWW